MYSEPIKNKDNIDTFDIENSLGFLISKTHQYFSLSFKEKLSSFNLTPPQFGALSFLWRQDGISQVQLGNLMGKDRTTIGGIIDRLEKDALVIRQSDPGDRRTNLVYLTARGAELKDILEQFAVQVNSEVTESLTDNERDQLQVLLKKILNNFHCEDNSE